MRSIDEIIAHLQRNMIAKPTLYEVYIFAPNAGNQDAPLDVTLNCSAVAVPGVNMSYTQDKRTGIGVVQNFPNTKSFNEVSLSFYESEKQNERKYFVDWMNMIYDTNTKRFGFYRDYTRTIVIKQFDRSNNVVHEARLFDCFPANISPLDKSYSMTDTLPQFGVSISFNEMQEIFYATNVGN